MRADRTTRGRPSEREDCKTRPNKPAVTSAEECLKKWQVKPGQLWRIPSASTPGESHRLLCGDSARPADMRRVMNGRRAMLLSTDPPYGVTYRGAKTGRGKKWEGIANDDRKGDDYRTWLGDCLRLWESAICDGAACYVWAAAVVPEAASAVRDAGFHLQSQIVWKKNVLTLGRNDYHWKHEICWYGYRRGGKHRWFGGRKQTTVWEIKKVPNGKYQHPMQKPVELYAIPIRNHTLAGELLAEPFAGSGTQFVAAEQLGRVCYGIEVEPRYVAVCLERMSELGLEPRPTRR